MTDEHKRDIDEHTGVETTGHSWDGIKELNNPLPRWWLWIFYATVAWAVIYMILMPAIPGLPGGTSTSGVMNDSARSNVAAAVSELQAARAESGAQLLNASLTQIEEDRSLQQFALAMGESAFGDNCATCHGAGGRGAKGYPILADDIWLWDGTVEGIEYTLKHGIRHEADPDTRFSMMPAYGEILSRDEINDLTQYVLHYTGRATDMDAVSRATENFNSQCVTCHGPQGLGDRTQGAPNIADDHWQFGGTPEEIRYTITNAQNAHMPAWSGRLDEATIKALAVYVHTLGGGE
jgi:cytochrome c oxidase cbb3-type subunit 3